VVKLAKSGIRGGADSDHFKVHQCEGDWGMDMLLLLGAKMMFS
jgi:hypothetical protein